MKKLQKKLFIEALNNQLMTDYTTGDRRRRSEARYNVRLLEMVQDALPSVVNYNITDKGKIKFDFINLNLSKANYTIELLGTNTPGAGDKKQRYTIILCNKASLCGCFKIKTDELSGERITLETLQNLIAEKKAVKYEKLNEVFGI